MNHHYFIIWQANTRQIIQHSLFNGVASEVQAYRLFRVFGYSK